MAKVKGLTLVASSTNPKMKLVPRMIDGSATIDPASMAAAAPATLVLQTNVDIVITCKGASIGDPVFCGFSPVLPVNCIWFAQVTAADTVTVRLYNVNGAGAVDVVSTVCKATVFKW